MNSSALSVIVQLHGKVTSTSWRRPQAFSEAVGASFSGPPLQAGQAMPNSHLGEPSVDWLRARRNRCGLDRPGRARGGPAMVRGSKGRIACDAEGNRASVWS